MANRPYLFVSYAGVDERAVQSFLEPFREEITLRALPIEVWQDQKELQPGTAWERTILDALNDAVGMLVFVSEASMASEWVGNELQSAGSAQDRFVVPIILQHGAKLPFLLANRIGLDISQDLGDPAQLREHAARLAEALSHALAKYRGRGPLSRRDAEKFAQIAAAEARKTAAPPSEEESSAAPSSVFVVHGHDTATLKLVCDVLRDFGVDPVVLSQAQGQSQSLLQNFFEVSKRARFAVVLLTADDYGASLTQFDSPGVAERALQFRARQNVVLELGFFYGQLGWENVFVLQRKPSRVFPNFERPSDLEGVVFDEIDDEGAWERALMNKLRDVGFMLKYE